jgi:competence protein ComEC
MRIWTIAFAVGVLCALQLPELPPRLVYLLWITVLFLHRYALWRPCAAVLAGFLWCLLRADVILLQALDPDLEGADVLLTGTVHGIPEATDRGSRFNFSIDTLQDMHGRSYATPGRVRLTWYFNDRDVSAGERWRFKARLKRPRGFSNPGGFDYEFWLFQQRLRASGYVRGETSPVRLAAARWYDIHRLRHGLAERISELLDEYAHTGLVIALATGSRHRLDADTWTVLQRTGTGHLLAISGLHVGIVAAMFFFLGRWGWSLSGRGMLWIPARDAGLIASFLAAAFYAALAGFSVPTQRALVMLTVLILAGLSRRDYAPATVLAVAVLAVLLLDPLAIITAGFWLSFTAVACILYGMVNRIGRHGWWWRWGRAQLFVTVGLLPVLLFWFQGASLVSVPANLVAIPFVSLLVVPLVLLAAAGLLLGVPGMAGLLMAADFFLHGLWQYLSWLSDFDFAMWQHGAVSATAMVLAMAGVVLFCLPRGVPVRWPAVAWLMPLFFPSITLPDSGEIRFTLLDVGQGLAAVVQTREHVLVYDTGARFSEHFNAGDAVLLPFLREHGIGAIDTLVISHGDNDHIGGSAALLAAMPVGRVLTSVPEKIAHSHSEHCHAGQSWNRDGVYYRVLHPPPDSAFSGNNASCILHIRYENGSLLLTGDIEETAERSLITRYGGQLQSEIMMVPHHGSKTSSSAIFLDTVKPELALVPAGYRNRYGFPKQAIMARYRERGVRVMNTAEAGAIIIDMTGEGYSVQAYRDRHRRFWHSRN